MSPREAGGRNTAGRSAWAFPEAMVRGHERLVPSMRNHEKDRHVAAAAVKAKAQAIVTSNIRDFRLLPEGIEAQRPDEFLCGLLEAKSEVIIGVLRDQAADLRRPPMSVGDVLARLERVVPRFVAGVRGKFD